MSNLAKCPKCGEVLAEDDVKCPTCGKRISKSEANTKHNDTVNPIVEKGDSSGSNATEYWASAKAEKFHLPTCEWAEKISDDNKIIYQSRDDAIEDGKVPCGACNP